MSLKKEKIEEKIRIFKTKKLKYQLRTYLMYAFLITLVLSKGLDSSYVVLKCIFSFLVIISSVFMLINLNKWLNIEKYLNVLNKALYEK